ncbi:Uncharacterised protein [Streptococcus pneumoniae]|nr:Uncharacterised protein [Streptococcus pneumoniae]
MNFFDKGCRLACRRFFFGIFIIIQGIHDRDSRSNQAEDTTDSSNGFLKNSKAFFDMFCFRF